MNDMDLVTRWRPTPDCIEQEWSVHVEADVLRDIFDAGPEARPTSRRPVARLAAVAACVATAATAVAVALPNDEPAAAATLHRLARVAGRSGATVGVGQFAYVYTTSTAPAAPKPAPDWGVVRVNGQDTITTRTWTAPDGDQWVDEGLGSAQACRSTFPYDGPDSAAPGADYYRRHTPPGVVVSRASGSAAAQPSYGAYGNLSAEALATLPTSAGPLADFIDAHPSGDNRGPVNRFLAVTDLLRSGLASPALRAAALDVLADTDGFVVEPDAHDSLGRAAIRVAPEDGVVVDVLYFDPATSALLEDRAGQDVGVVVESGVVDTLPAGPAACR